MKVFGIKLCWLLFFWLETFAWSALSLTPTGQLLNLCKGSSVCKTPDDLENERAYPAPVILSVKTEKPKRGCAVTIETGVFRDPVNQKPNLLEFRRVRPTSSSDPIPTVVLLGPGSRETYFERGYALDLCSRGIQALILRNFEHNKEMAKEWGSENDFTNRSQAAARTLMSLSNGPVGILGTSIGAMTGALVSSLDSRVKAFVSIVGGAPFSEIYSKIPIPKLWLLKRYRMNKFKIKTKTEYATELSKHFPLDAKNTIPQAKALPPSLLIIGGKDKIAPTSTQFELASLLKPKDIIIEEKTGHIMTSVVAYTRHQKRITNFLSEELLNSAAGCKN